LKQTLIISYYQNIPFLKLVLESVELQSYRDFEVIIAEDDESLDLPVFLNQNSYSFPIRKISHSNLGFRKNKIMNEAVGLSNGEQLIFIDMDCILHKHFLYQYAKNLKPGFFGCGRRGMLSPKYTQLLLKNGLRNRITILQMLLTGSKIIEDTIYYPFYKSKKNRPLLGSNWGILKKDFLAVNGYDEDYQSSSVGEDVDIEWRLKKAKMKALDMKNLAIQYHLDHPFHYNRERVLLNMEVKEKKESEGIFFCKNGIAKIP
jgi:glycosyltransferase involved in cell wall biosynthesis